MAIGLAGLSWLRSGRGLFGRELMEKRELDASRTRVMRAGGAEASAASG